MPQNHLTDYESRWEKLGPVVQNIKASLALGSLSRGFVNSSSSHGIKVYLYFCLYIMCVYVRRFGEFTSNKHNISVALDRHGMLN